MYQDLLNLQINLGHKTHRKGKELSVRVGAGKWSGIECGERVCSVWCMHMLHVGSCCVESVCDACVVCNVCRMYTYVLYVVCYVCMHVTITVEPLLFQAQG